MPLQRLELATKLRQIKQLDLAKDAVTSIATNALLPHRAAALCKKRGARLIQFSTDCVFAGRNGPFAENSPTDAEDLYGRSKLLGELNDTVALTLRLSVIGPELASPICKFAKRISFTSALDSSSVAGARSVVEPRLIAVPGVYGVSVTSAEPKFTVLLMAILSAVSVKLPRPENVLPIVKS